MNNLLIIQSSPEILEYLKEIFSNKYKVDTASNFSDGVEFLRKKNYPVIITGLFLYNEVIEKPIKFKGIDIIIEVSKIIPFTNVIVFSGNPNVYNNLDADISAYIFKFIYKLVPYPFQELQKYVEIGLIKYLDKVNERNYNLRLQLELCNLQINFLKQENLVLKQMIGNHTIPSSQEFEIFKLKELLSENRIKEVFQKLKKNIAKDQDKYNSILILQSHFYRIEEDNIRGILDVKSYYLEINILCNSLLKLINSI